MMTTAATATKATSKNNLSLASLKHGSWHKCGGHLAGAADTAVMADMATTAAAVTKAASKINLLSMGSSPFKPAIKLPGHLL